MWRNRAPRGLKAAGILVASGIIIVGGYAAAVTLSQPKEGVAAVTYETTIEQPVTVMHNGKTVVRHVRVVRRVFIRGSTAFDTRLVTVPGHPNLVVQRVVKYVPVIHRRVVKVNGKTKIITETRLVRTTSIRTQVLTNVVTDAQTVVNQNTVTLENNRVVTVPVTVTENHTETVVETQTLPADTVIKTVTETVTETAPPVTVTETVTVPSSP